MSHPKCSYEHDSNTIITCGCAHGLAHSLQNMSCKEKWMCTTYYSTNPCVRTVHVHSVQTKNLYYYWGNKKTPMPAVRADNSSSYWGSQRTFHRCHKRQCCDASLSINILRRHDWIVCDLGPDFAWVSHFDSPMHQAQELPTRPVAATHFWISAPFCHTIWRRHAGIHNCHGKEVRKCSAKNNINN